MKVFGIRILAIYGLLIPGILIIGPLLSWAQNTVSSERSPIREVPNLRVSTYSVVVDVVVTGKDNRPVTDLTRDDFLIYEDGILQEIESFQAVTPESVPGDLEMQDAPASVSGMPTTISPAEPIPNLVILLLDYATVEYLNQVYVRDAAVEYVKTRLQPADLMAVFKVGRGLVFSQQFTNDKMALIKALHQRDTSGSAYAADQELSTMMAESTQDYMETLTSQLDTLSNGAAGTFSPQVIALMEGLSRELEIAQKYEGTYYAYSKPSPAA